MVDPVVERLGITKQPLSSIQSRPPIDNITLDSMATEAHALPLPASLYTLALALSKSRSVLLHHDASWEEKENEENISLRMHNLHLRGSRSDGDRNQLKIQKYTEMKYALNRLVTSKSSINTTVNDWEEAKKWLGSVLDIPNQDGCKEDPTDEIIRADYFQIDGNVNHCRKRAHNRRIKIHPIKKIKITVADYFRDIRKETKKRGIPWHTNSTSLLKRIQSTKIPPLIDHEEEETAIEIVKSSQIPARIADRLNRLDKLHQKNIKDQEKIANAKQDDIKASIEIDIKRREEKERQEEERKEEEARERASSLLRPLTEHELNIVNEAIYGVGPPGEVLASSDTDSVQRQSLHRLQDGQWINDETIHYFYQMLANRDKELCDTEPNRKRSHFFKSFFLTKLYDEGASNEYRYNNVKRWSKRVPGKDIFKLKNIFFPCNVSNMHWTCVVVYMEEKRIQFYDSMGGDGMYWIKGLMKYLKDEWKAKKGGELPDADKWKLVAETPDAPRQENGFDCGVFTCIFADFLAKDCPLHFSQKHITQCRQRIALSIMKGSAVH